MVNNELAEYLVVSLGIIIMAAPPLIMYADYMNKEKKRQKKTGKS